MRRGIFTIVALLAAIVCAAGCIFGPSRFKGIKSYRDGRVYLYYNPNRFYRVGILPDGWERIKTGVRTVTFYNSKYKGSISTDAECGNSVEGRTLISLTGGITSALENPTVKEQKEFMLGGRGAIRQDYHGTYDGVPMVVDLIVVRKSGCIFDFYLTMPRTENRQAVADFEFFVDGFRYDG